MDGRRNVLARNAGRRIVEMVHEDLVLSKILTRQAFENAIRTLAAIGGSTNAVIHLIAIARRIGVDLTVEDFDRLGSTMPCLVNLQPSGKYLMEDFCYAGGLPAVMKEISPACTPAHRHRQRPHRGENIADAENFNPEVIQPLDKPFMDKAGIAVCCAQPGAARRRHQAQRGHRRRCWCTHRRAVVFEDIEDFHRRIDDENLDVDETCVLVLKNCGPKGLPRHG